MKYFIYAYKNGSESAKKLRDALGAKLLKHEGSNFKPGWGKLVINWGFGGKLPFGTLNTTQAVNVAGDKLKTLHALEGKEYCIPFTTDKEEAKKYLENSSVVCRTILRGNSGNGIIIADEEVDIVDAPLYTCYIPKKEEYRVHVFGGKAIHVQRKAKRYDVPREEANYKIRNHANGFIFQKDDFVYNDKVKEVAIDAVVTLGLTFGAVDVIWNERKDKYYVLEVNTAPGIEGATLERYVEAIKNV
ncbi:MAG TPA: hypothetical protein VFM18_21875 [Methanosarcina sp.]|nr:hypothetical protein [Methanosarcina sp.]